MLATKLVRFRFRHHYLSLLLLLAASSGTKAQTLLTPASNAFDKKLLQPGSYDMACYINVNGQQREFATFNFQVQVTDKTLAIYTVVETLGSTQPLIDTSISELNTFKPIYRSSFGQAADMVIQYGKEINGYHLDKKTNKRTTIKEANTNAYFDGYAYPYILGLLPLTTGYKTDLSVYEYKPTNSTNIKKARIEEVKSHLFTSPSTGEHKVWAVTVFEESTGDRYTYYVDKEIRRLWKVEVTTKGQQIVMVDKETDFNPIEAKFDKTATLNMVTKGNSVIIGEAFKRDNQNEGMLKGIAVLNINKKQHAQAGTTIVLIPYTDYFKEWMEENDKQLKKGRRGIPLPQEARDCIKMTTVYDNKGSFEFTSLQPGKYLLYTEFGYIHTSSRTEVVGYTDTYIGGNYQGTRTNTTTYNVNSNATARVKKIVTIDTDGEKVEVKLKQTL